MKKQFDGYVAIDDVHVNGKLTLGENVADLGGMKLAFAAMQAYAREHPERAATPARFTPEQPFFVGTAQAWCTNSRPQEARRLATIDPHAPGAVPGERAALQPDRVPAGVRVQGRGQDGGPEPLRGLVAPSQPRGSVQWTRSRARKPARAYRLAARA